jgi:hypothetical protein
MLSENENHIFIFILFFLFQGEPTEKSTNSVSTLDIGSDKSSSDLTVSTPSRGEVACSTQSLTPKEAFLR